MADRRTGLDLVEKVSGVARTQEELDRFVHDVCAAAMNHFRGCVGVSIYLVLDGGLRAAGFATRGASDETAYHDPDHSECLAIMRRPVTLATVDRLRGSWPGFADFMDRQGFGSVLSVPLVVDHTVIGSMGLYSASPEDFDEVDVKIAGAAGQVCAGSVAAALEIIGAREIAEQLETAMQSRATIEQAKGILMAVRGVSEDEAFEIIRKSSQDRNIKVRTLAEHIVSGAVDLSSRASRR